MNTIKAVGIVAEYNPFHKGHAYHIEKAKEATSLPVIAIMSGSFMQRGEPAIASPWIRAEMAIRSGADLVLQLPAVYSLRSAQYFAQGAVESLAATGCVSHLACGVESPNTDFYHLAQALETTKVQAAIRTHLKNGLSYARACSTALLEEKTFVTEDNTSAQLSLPNDVLALSYCQAIVRAQASIEPVFIERKANQYNDVSIESTLASASAIRKSLAMQDSLWQKAVPPFVADYLRTNTIGYDAATFWLLIRYQLRKLTPQQIAATCQCSEGLENLLKQASDCATLDQALELCTNKRYTTSRIRRLLCQLLLGQPREILEQSSPAYLRVLAFNDTGRGILKQMRKTSLLPIITKLGKKPERGQSEAFTQQMKLDLLATDIWSLLSKNPQPNKSGLDYITSPIYVKTKIE